MSNQKNKRSADKIADKGGFRGGDSGRKSFGMSGERGRNRTYNLLIKSQLLCQLSYAPARETPV